MTRLTKIIAFTLTVALALLPAGEAMALTRAEIVGRAKRWVDLKVPYSQASYFETYRQDCSGMASMAWRLDRSYSTRTLAPFGEPVTRDELQPGDMLLKYDYHAAIFYKWANAEHTHYWTLEQSGGTGHAISRLTLYPYWGHDGFSAYRPRNIVEVNDYGPYIDQVSGADRYATAIAASSKAFASGEASRAVVASGQTWPDALGGSALAGALGGPVLLVGREHVPSGLAAEVARLGVTELVIVGGEAAVSEPVAAALDSLPGVSVRRIGGGDRFETASLIASETVKAIVASGRTYDGSFYLATGAKPADALGAATVAAYKRRPVLLSRQSALPTVTADAIRSIAATRALVAGGEAAVGTTATAGLADAGVWSMQRFSGSDRYETAYLLAQHGVAEGLAWQGVAVANGQGFADALAGAVMQAKRGSVLVLTPSDRLVPGADKAIRGRLAPGSKVVVLGGESAIEPRARRQMRWVLVEP